jgi:hypothetical protein
VSREDQMQVIRNILIEDWDPVGFGPLLPADEYDTYIPGIAHLLEKHCTVEQLEAHLVRIEKHWFGEAQANRRAHLAAKNLVVSWFASP